MVAPFACSRLVGSGCDERVKVPFNVGFSMTALCAYSVMRCGSRSPGNCCRYAARISSDRSSGWVNSASAPTSANWRSTSPFSAYGGRAGTAAWAHRLWRFLRPQWRGWHQCPAAPCAIDSGNRHHASSFSIHLRPTILMPVLSASKCNPAVVEFGTIVTAR